MKLPDRTSGLTKLLALSLLAAIANVPARGASAAELAARATCSAPDRSASFKAAYAPEYPSIARKIGATGSTAVRVRLARSGALVSATVARSSGFSILDNEALVSARESTYEPETVSCQPVSGDYLVNIAFEE